MGELFSVIRKKAGFETQEELATALGLADRSTVAQWENGNRYPRTPMIPEVAKLLNVTSDEIIKAITQARLEKEGK